MLHQLNSTALEDESGWPILADDHRCLAALGGGHDR